MTHPIQGCCYFCHGHPSGSTCTKSNESLRLHVLPVLIGKPTFILVEVRSFEERWTLDENEDTRLEMRKIERSGHDHIGHLAEVKSNNYKCIATISHHGETISAGHFTCELNTG